MKKINLALASPLMFLVACGGGGGSSTNGTTNLSASAYATAVVNQINTLIESAQSNSYPINGSLDFATNSTNAYLSYTDNNTNPTVYAWLNNQPWKSIYQFPDLNFIPNTNFAISNSGTIYWGGQCGDNYQQNCIYSLTSNQESFQSMSLPDSIKTGGSLVNLTINNNTLYGYLGSGSSGIGQIYKYDGSSWSSIDLPDDNNNVNSIVADGGNNLYIVAYSNNSVNNKLFEYTDNEWKEITTPSVDGYQLTNIAYNHGNIYLELESSDASSYQIYSMVANSVSANSGNWTKLNEIPLTTGGTINSGISVDYYGNVYISVETGNSNSMKSYYQLAVAAESN